MDQLIDLRRLRYFVALAEDLHFTRAAQRLHIAQPALSQAVRQLERELQVELFHRTRRHVELTAAGAVLLGDARRILGDVAAAVQRARAAQLGRDGLLRIGFSDAAATHLLPTLLRAYAQRFPDIEVLLHPIRTTTAIGEAVSAGEVELGLTGLVDENVFERSITFLQFAEERLVVALAADNPLSATDVIDLATLDRTDVVLPIRSADPHFHDVSAEQWRAAGGPIEVVAYATTMSALYGFVASGIGIAIVPKGMERLSDTAVAFRPTVQRLPAIKLGVLWDNTRSDGTRDAFLALTRELGGDRTSAG